MIGDGAESCYHYPRHIVVTNGILPLTMAYSQYRRHLTIADGHIVVIDGILPFPTVCYRYRRHIVVTDGILLFPTAYYRYRRYIVVTDDILRFPTAHYSYRRHIAVIDGIFSLPTAHYRYRRHTIITDDARYGTGTGSTHFFYEAPQIASRIIDDCPLYWHPPPPSPPPSRGTPYPPARPPALPSSTVRAMPHRVLLEHVGGKPWLFQQGPREGQSTHAHQARVSKGTHAAPTI